MKRRLKGISVGLGIVVTIAVSFLVGAAAGESGWVTGVSPVSAAESEIELTIFMEAWGLIEAHFIDRERLDGDRLSYAAINAIITELGDTGHTRFLSPEEANAHSNSMDGRFFGIGATLGVDEEGAPIIVEPFYGSPAESAGILAEDKLIEVDGLNVTTWTINQIVERVRGEEGTVVTLLILHKGAVEPESIAVVRGEIVVPALSWAMVPESKIAHIHLNQFSANANEELTRVLEEIQANGATGVILDVRDNPGGLLDQAIRVSSQFLSEGNVLQEANYLGERREFGVNTNGKALDISMVVLVNQGSASSSEIFAGAIQDHNRGKVIGDKTFGTGTVLTPYNLSDGSLLLLGTSEWLTADGRSIRNVGISPDIIIGLPAGARALRPAEVAEMTNVELIRARDSQLLKAISTLDSCWDYRACNEALRRR